MSRLDYVIDCNRGTNKPSDGDDDDDSTAAQTTDGDTFLSHVRCIKA